MSERELRVNVYNSSKVGHANVSFYTHGEHQYTIGANIRLEGPQLAVPRVLAIEPDDGIYRDESAFHLAATVEGIVESAAVPVTEEQYDSLLSVAHSLENNTFNYSLFTEACTDLVEDFYTATGHPGEFGDLFADDVRTGSLVWDRVPVSDLATVWPDQLAYYTPDGPVDSDIDPADVIAPVSDPQWAEVVSTAERGSQSASDARVDELSAEDGLGSSEHIDLDWGLDAPDGLGFGIAEPVEPMPITYGADDSEFDLSEEMSALEEEVDLEGGHDDTGSETMEAPQFQGTEDPDPTISVSADPWDEPDFQFGSPDFGRTNHASEGPESAHGHNGDSEGNSGFGTGGFGADPMSKGMDVAASVSSEDLSFGGAYEGGLGDYESFGPATNLSFDIDREPAGAQDDFGMTDDPWDF